jgi:endonuclease/exonuclease/phosphatase (EEP) superfamily protein YafD
MYTSSSYAAQARRLPAGGLCTERTPLFTRARLKRTRSYLAHAEYVWEPHVPQRCAHLLSVLQVARAVCVRPLTAPRRAAYTRAQIEERVRTQ